ncbi:MAG: type IV pilus assembly protein PilM [Candidatus Omnitrophota bacterium]|nr:type IV pilus assembly protein PilM [Candidatus Omnitrophota bacterium]
MKFIREKICAGLDIGTHSVKVVKLKFAKDAVELCGFDVIPTQAGLADALKKIKEAQNIDNVNISFCGPATVIRYVDFPMMAEKELKQALKFEAQKHIPFPISEINLDSCILKQDLKNNKMLVLLAGIKKDLLSQRLELIAGAGFKVKAVDLDSLALFNAFKFNYFQEDFLKTQPPDLASDDKSPLRRFQKGTSFALLNIGASMSNLDIIENGILCLSRDIPIAGNNFTQKLMDIFNLDMNCAEELKISPDQERQDKMSAGFEPILSNLIKEIKLGLDYFESQSASSVSKIFLGGAGAKLPGLESAFLNLLGLELDYWDPFKRISLSTSIDAERHKSLSGQIAVAVGLALRE